MGCGGPCSRGRGLLQAVLDLVEPSADAGVVQLAAGSAGGANCSDRLVAQLDWDASAEKHHMRQLGEGRDRIFALGAFGERKRIVLERRGGIGLVKALSSVKAPAPSPRMVAMTAPSA